MKVISLANRLSRDLSEKSMADLTADTKQELLDAINGGLQRLNSLAPAESKTVPISIPLAAPLTIALGVTNGSYDITGHDFAADECYRTIVIDGDDLLNSVVGANELFHPYSGTTGTVSATLYCDAVMLPEPYSSLIGDPRIMETMTTLIHFQPDALRRKHPARPNYYWMEANARNQNPPAPLVMRFDTLPDRAYRLESKAVVAPTKITFSDLLTAGIDVPLIDEHVECYLLPVARGLLSSSGMWRNKETVAMVRDDAKAAENRYATLVPTTFATPRNLVRTKQGF